MTYAHVQCRKTEGAHYTPPELGSFLANAISPHINSNEPLVICDPAIGSGELLIAMLQRVPQSTSVHLIGFDTNAESLEICRARLIAVRPDAKLSLFNEDFLVANLRALSVPLFDIVIANPPYVRVQLLGKNRASNLAATFGLNGRIDAYQAFLIAIGGHLSKNGVAGTIVSNRLLTTQSAQYLRAHLERTFKIHDIWDLGDTKQFEAAVLPCVLTYSKVTDNTDNNSAIRFHSIYETQSPATHHASTSLDAIGTPDQSVVSCDNNKRYFVRHGTLAPNKSALRVWRLDTQDISNWLECVKSNTWGNFGVHFDIRVGIKTTADKVFIDGDWDHSQPPELLQPLITHHVAGQIRPTKTPSKKVLYPHAHNTDTHIKGSAVDITRYPLSMKYLQRHQRQLSSRQYVIDAGRQWYEIWVPQRPEKWAEPKLVFRDISEKPMFWFDDSGAVVNGDCFWMTSNSGNDDLLWLAAAIANTSFIEKFYDLCFNNKLYAGKRRFITQYVKHFPLPNPENESSKELIALAKDIGNEDDEHIAQEKLKLLDNKVHIIFGVEKEAA